MMRRVAIAVFLSAVLSGSWLLAPAGASAAETCGGFQSVCAARCKQRAPQDVNCVSDHCTPKLTECRKTGCWQEGERYGGKLSCGLKKT